MMIMQCKKCNSVGMSGPTWNKATDRLDFRCACGWTTSIPCADASENSVHERARILVESQQNAEKRN